MAKVIGEGTIVQLEKDKPKSKCRKWQLRVPVGLDPRTGKYKTRTRRVKDMTYTQAKKALRDFIEEIEDDKVWRRTGTTFEECAADFMERRDLSGEFSQNTQLRCRRCFKAVSRHIGKADVALITRIDDKASFAGDLSWSIEALQNVLKNSLEHTPAGGTVTIDVVEDPLACRLIVTDTGPGIDEEDLPHIFERFYRGSAKHAESAEVNPAGVGIGLALARSLVVAQDGRIRARNVRDADGIVTGAQFEIAFFKATV